MNTVEDLPDILKRERKRRGKNQQEAANIIGKKRSCYAAYEEGRAYPSIPSLQKFAQAYGYKTVDDLLGQKNDKIKKDDISILVESYMSSSKRKREIVDYILGLKK